MQTAAYSAARVDDAQRDSRHPGNAFARGSMVIGVVPQAQRMNIWLPPRDSNPDMLIQSQLSCR